MHASAASITDALRRKSSRARKVSNERFFKVRHRSCTFMGVRTPDIRAIAKKIDVRMDGASAKSGGASVAMARKASAGLSDGAFARLSDGAGALLGGASVKSGGASARLSDGAGALLGGASVKSGGASARLSPKASAKLSGGAFARLSDGAFAWMDGDELKLLLHSNLHEARLCGFLILLYQYQRKGSDKAAVYKCYLENIACANNWDIIDTTTPGVIGEHLLHHKKERKLLGLWRKDESLWMRRIAILASFPFIQRGDFSVTLNIAEKLLEDKEDLIHKALGWMLREIYKRDAATTKTFLKQNYAQLPRTTLRYAIERMPEAERKRALKGRFS